MIDTEYLLEKHLDSYISEEEKAILNERMLSYSFLAKELAFRREVNSLAHEYDIDELRLKLSLAFANTQQNHSKRIIMNKTKRLFYAAAAITGITIGGWALLYQNNSITSTETLYNEFYSPYPPVVVYRDALVPDVYTNLQIAMKHYEKGEFAEAAEQLERINLKTFDSVTAKFYLGITYMQLEQFSDSRILFDQVISSEVIFSELAIWYKGLCYLAENNTNKAIETFSMIEKNGTQYGIMASKLIDLLDSN